MEQMQDLNIMLAQMPFPAFLALDGRITNVNPSAAQRMAEVDSSVLDILVTGKEEYQAFQQGSLYLTVCLGSTQYLCCVTQLKQYQLFTLEEDTSNLELQALALAAQQLYFPLSEITLIMDRLSGSGEDKARITQNLFRLHRMICNMSDAGQFVSASPKMITCELCSLLEEVFEKAGDSLSQAGITLRYTLPQRPVFSLAEPEMVKRAVYNLISNAAKHSSAGKSVEISVRASEARVYIAVTDSSGSNSLPGSIFRRYSRQPGMEDPQTGLGLGMTLIHATAAAHGGTVLVRQNDGAGLTVTMSLAIKKAKDSQLRSPVIIPDIYGGRDQALIELSDVLPYQLYGD